jgi:formamidopyrimidine-DNA glycosylase
MPELPEVELFKHHLDETSLGRRIDDAVVNDRRIIGTVEPGELAARLKGAQLTASRRHGKYLLIDPGKSGWLALHFGMNGSLHYYANGAEEPPYDRLRLDFAGDGHLAYVNPRRIGSVELVPDPATFIAREGLGPDALDPGFGADDFAQALQATKRDVKSALMDQALVAGIGNLYSDEILFQAQLHPRTPTNAPDRAALRRLFTKMRSVLETAVRDGAGSEQMLDRLPRGFLLPQRKKVGRCPRCGGAIATLKSGGRTSYFCPHCQPAPR